MSAKLPGNEAASYLRNLIVLLEWRSSIVNYEIKFSFSCYLLYPSTDSDPIHQNKTFQRYMQHNLDTPEFVQTDDTTQVRYGARYSSCL